MTQRLMIPAGTTMYPEECGFVLPDGRYLRLYAGGAVEEWPNGRARSGVSPVKHPQLFAHRIRVGGNPHAMGPSAPAPSYRTDVDVEFVLPGEDELTEGGDEALIDLSA